MTSLRSYRSSVTLLAFVATVCGAALVGSATQWSASAWMGWSLLAVGLAAVIAGRVNFRQTSSLPLVPHNADKPAEAPRTQPGQGPCAVPLGEIIASFNSNFSSHTSADHLWPAFDRWLRDTLAQFLGARRVRCFRVAEGGHRLTSLSGAPDEQFWSGKPPHGLVDHVMATGRSYLRGHADNGELTEQLAADWAHRLAQSGAHPGLPHVPDWLVPVQDQGRTIGMLVVGELGDNQNHDFINLQAVEQLCTLLWRWIYQGDELGIAQRTDRASGVLNRIDLTTRAEQVVAESTRDSEPLVVLALSVEGVRRLDDGGEWELRDWLMRQIGLHMRRKLRSDDLVGRFSDDRFVAVLRRLDMSLGQLIARKLLAAAHEGLHCQPTIERSIILRCGLAQGGTGDAFEDVLVRAFNALQAARSERAEIMIAPSGATRHAQECVEAPA